MPHTCIWCKRNIECEADKNAFSLCDCECMKVTEHKIKSRVYFCNSDIFPSCFENYLMKKYEVSYLKLMTLHRKNLQ